MRSIVISGALALVVALVNACGFGDKPDLPPVLPDDLVVGSSQPGGGALGVLFDFAEEVVLTRSATLGPLVVYSAIDPAFDGLTEDDPDASLYVLSGEIPLAVELVAIDAGAELRLDASVLAQPGDTAEIVMGPGVHFHPEWRVIAPEGPTPGPHDVTFRLGDASGRYGTSQTFTLTLVVTDPS